MPAYATRSPHWIQRQRKQVQKKIFGFDHEQQDKRDLHHEIKGRQFREDISQQDELR